MPIEFGTDGWRGVVGEDYTLENVRICAQGTADLMREQGLAARGLVVGYDTRLDSEKFAVAVAEVSTANDIVTFLCDKASTTPAVAYNVVARDAGAGVVITASHNPACWNGFKYKPHYGGSASAEIVERLEEYIALAETSNETKFMPLPNAQANGMLEYIDPEPTYLSHIATMVDLESIRKAGLRIVVDPMFGAGAGYFTKLLSGGSTEITEIRSNRNPTFPGMSQPEPIAQNLELLMETVPAGSFHVGLATDGDADRLGLVDENGQFLTTLQSFALLCLYQLEVLGRRGPLVRSITMTRMIDRLGAIYDVPVFDTPVGFKHLGPVMMREDALIAGEESGGYAFRGSIPERDGVLSGLMLLDMMVRTDKSPSELLVMLEDMVGQHFYDRWDLEFNPKHRESVQERISSAFPSIFAGFHVDEVDTRDGYRFILEGGNWVLIRFSGTEPLLRIYAEADSKDEVDDLLTEAQALVGI